MTVGMRCKALDGGVWEVLAGNVSQTLLSFGWSLSPSTRVNRLFVQRQGGGQSLLGAPKATPNILRVVSGLPRRCWCAEAGRAGTKYDRREFDIVNRRISGMDFDHGPNMFGRCHLKRVAQKRGRRVQSHIVPIVLC